MRRAGGEPPGPTDADQGLWQGRSVARRFTSAEGFVVLVGRTARDNDLLTLRLAAPRDFWLHVAGTSGSHVVVRNPDGLARLPRETERFAAGLAAGFSRARPGAKVTVHVATRAQVSKPRGLPAGKVHLGRFRTVQVEPVRP